MHGIGGKVDGGCSMERGSGSSRFRTDCGGGFLFCGEVNAFEIGGSSGEDTHFARGAEVLVAGKTEHKDVG
jgi:hypothetical protein